MGEPVHSPLPWAYRSQPHDDWGVIRSPTNEKGWTPVVAIARGVEGDGRSHDDHFRARTDPYEANGRLIVDRVNGWDALAAERDALQARVRDLEAALETCRPTIERCCDEPAINAMNAALSPTDAVGEPNDAEVAQFAENNRDIVFAQQAKFFSELRGNCWCDAYTMPAGYPHRPTCTASAPQNGEG